MPRVSDRAFRPSESIVQSAGAPPVSARQNTIDFPSSDALARKSHTSGTSGVNEAIRLALERFRPGEVHASVKSYNNHVGVPISLARLPREATYGVFEIGMNHAGEITPLTKMVRPHIAVITTVAAAHLEFFKSVTEIAEAVEQAKRLVSELGVRSLCVHGDHPEAVAFAREVRRALDADRVTLRPFVV